MYEIELHFGGDDPHVEFLVVDAATKTELENIALAECKKHKAIAFSFGPVVLRNERGEVV